MITTKKGRDLLKHYEGLRLKPYDDQTGKEIKKWVKGATIGYGHLIIKDEWDKYKDGIDADSANAIFNADLISREQAVNNAIRVPLKSHEFDALVVLEYNIGAKALYESSVIKMINMPGVRTRYQNLEQAWKAWNKSQGKIMAGLGKRRQVEWDIYSKGIYKWI